MKLLLNLVVLFGISGCGTMFDDDSKDSISIPKEISMKIPKILQKSKEAKKTQNISQGYIKLKSSVQEIVESQQIANINLLFAQQIIYKVERRCKNHALESRCIIEAGEISFLFDEKFIVDVEAITKESVGSDFDEIANRSIPLGQVEFTQYDLEEAYQYSLKIDTTPISELLNYKGRSIQTLKWSKNKNRIVTILDDESESGKEIFDIFYLKKENGEREMSINSHYQSKLSIEKSNFHLQLIDKNDMNNSFYIDLNYEDVVDIEDNIYEEFYVSRGKTSTQGGFLDIEGNYFEDRKFKEKYLFDRDGKILSSFYCVDNLICDMSDSSTWLDITPVSSIHQIRLEGEAGGLINYNQYFIFSPDVVLEDEEVLTVETQKRLLLWLIGEIYVVDNSIYGELFSNKYSTILDELVIARVVEKNDRLYIEVVSQEDRPDLKIFIK